MIFTDGVHMVSDVSSEELHAFAKKIGLKREWFQDNPTHPHYDLTTLMAASRALAMGAHKVSGREVVRITRRRIYEKEKG